MTTATAPSVRRHPIRGLLYGVMFGLGLAFVAIGQGFAALGTWPPLLLFVAGIVIGTAWSMFGPAKGARAPEEASTPAPVSADPEPADPASLDGESEID